MLFLLGATMSWNRSKCGTAEHVSHPHPPHLAHLSHALGQTGAPEALGRRLPLLLTSLAAPLLI